ncbi:30S ribosomal protein S5 [uncultured bacterium]|nr:30S ribosomal protein S5 [uncultured bacterium]
MNNKDSILNNKINKQNNPSKKRNVISHNSGDKDINKNTESKNISTSNKGIVKKDVQNKIFSKRRNSGEFNRYQNRDYQYLYSKVLLTKKTDKVISGGRNSGFMAIVVVGNCIDRVGLGSARGKTIVDAIAHAKQKATNRVIIPGKFNYTKERFCASSVIIKRRKINVIRSAGYLNPIFYACGMKNISCKIIGSNNPMNCIYAVFSALSKNIQNRRNILSLKQIINKNNNILNQEFASDNIE